jgi:Ca2+-binding RTX toxin-like protein
VKPGKAIVIALIVAATLPASAAGSTAQVTGAGELRFDGAAGEANSVTIRFRLASVAGFGGQTNRFVVEDKVPIQPGSPGCASIDSLSVSCDATPVSAINVALGDGDDGLLVSTGKGGGVPRRYRVRAGGGDGNDVIRGGDGDNRLYGEQGRDVVAGWSGDDLVSGGPGTDAVIGFTGDDRLLGGAAADALFAQKGHDRLLGGPGANTLSARDGQRDPVINCGGGGRAVIDRRDPRPRRCGSVSEPKTAKSA